MRDTNQVWLSCHFQRKNDNEAVKSDSIPDSIGCWFCSGMEGELVFDTEFDTPVHIDCIRNALIEDETHQEAVPMKYLLD